MKRKPPVKDRIKRGDRVAYTTRNRIVFATVISVQKDYRLLTLKLDPPYSQTEYFDAPISRVIPQSLYTARHHKLLLGVRP